MSASATFAKAIFAIAQACGVGPELRAVIEKQRGEFHLSLKSEGYLPLYIERVGEHQGAPLIAAAHWFTQNGDLMRDPEIVFHALSLDRWTPVGLTQHPVGHYSSAISDSGIIDDRKVRQYLPLANMWGRNLLDQGWADPKRISIENATVRVPGFVPFCVEDGKREVPMTVLEAVELGADHLRLVLAETPDAAGLHEALYRAAGKGAVDSVSVLLEHGASCDWNSGAAVRSAEIGGHHEVVRIIVEHAPEAADFVEEHKGGRIA